MTPLFADARSLVECRDCKHTESILTRRVIAGGALQFVYQCQGCGRAHPNPIPKSRIRNVDALPQFDTSIRETMMEREAAKRAATLKEKRQLHSEYLQTAEWRKRRELVMQRAGGLCEGCRSAPATQVHHMTYDHWGRELLFELVALCKPCHEVCHEDDDRNRPPST